jgi:signal transduction histidine kinase
LLVSSIGSDHRVDLVLAAQLVGLYLGAADCHIDVVDSRRGPVANGAGGVEVRSRGHQVGRLRYRAARKEDRAFRRRLAVATDALGPMVHAALLWDRIGAGVAEAAGGESALAHVRRRAVQAQRAERQALERNLHDGVQHRLVALRMGFGLLEHDLERGDAPAAAGRLSDVEQLLDAAEQALADTVTGTIPPVLVRQGLAAALDADLAQRSGLRVDADASMRARRYPPEVEFASFFGCLEAVNNALKHASGSPIRVQLTGAAFGFVWRVSDRGPGFDAPALDPRSGLGLLRDRITAVGGVLTLDSSAEGTVVTGAMHV